MGTYDRWRGGWDPRSAALVTDAGALDYAALHERVRRATGWLAGQGLGPGDVVGLALPKQADWLALVLGAVRLGAITLPLNDRAPEAELRWPLTDAGARLLVGVTVQGPWGGVSAADAAAGIDAAIPSDPPPPGDDAVALMLYTSGTTGRPKGVPLRLRQIEATVEALHGAWGWRSDDVLLHALPIYHVHGLIVAAFGALRAGAAQHWLARFDADEVLQRLARGPATVFMGVPTFYARLLEADGAWDLRRVRLATSGSAGLGAEVHRAVQARFGLQVVERYGMTEIGIVVSNRLGDPRPGSIGWPLPGVTVRVVGDGGEDVAGGEVGELWVRAPSAFDGYHGLPEATASTVVGGFVRTGDLGRREEDGRLTLVGRRSELILVGGFNVYPAEVERALLGCPGVREAAVYGAPDADLGEVPLAAVVGDVDPEALRGVLRGVLSSYKVPRRIRVVDALPRNAMGKVVKSRL
jgi:malonyl-CoA/methylmalonyl-CoA synthetase